MAREAVRKGSQLWVVTGFFDPLLAEHACRLGEIAGRDHVLMVIVAAPPDPVLPPRARAEMVAALGAVDYAVLPENGALEDLLKQLPAHEIAREENADRERKRDFIRHVRSRLEAN